MTWTINIRQPDVDERPLSAEEQAIAERDQVQGVRGVDAPLQPPMRAHAFARRLPGVRCGRGPLGAGGDAMPVIRLDLPYPISAKRYWKAITIPGRTMMAPSREAKAYKADVQHLALLAGVRAPLVGRVELAVQLFPQRPQDWQRRMRMDGATWDDSVRCIDLDNANKVLLDAIKGVVIEDDRWVRKLTSERMEPTSTARGWCCGCGRWSRQWCSRGCWRRRHEGLRLHDV